MKVINTVAPPTDKQLFESWGYRKGRKTLEEWMMAEEAFVAGLAAARATYPIPEYDAIKNKNNVLRQAVVDLTNEVDEAHRENHLLRESKKYYPRKKKRGSK